MVYRGKPSAGCDPCRKAKKRCGLEQPACLRCVKLKKQCSGYRDISQLQIQDESAAVAKKAEKKKAQAIKAQDERYATATAQLRPEPEAQTRFSTPFGYPTPATVNSDSSSGSDETVDIPMSDPYVFGNGSETQFAPIEAGTGLSMVALSTRMPLTSPILPKPDDIATHYFLKSFGGGGQWEYVADFAQKPTMDPCLKLALNACGMAALANVQNVPFGLDWSRSLYVDALSLINSALRDPQRSRTDESLIAVSMLSYYENLTCDSRASIQSWKAHIKGATQLLKLRGKQQFQTQVGRTLFRETRAQIMIHCIWDDLTPPAFLDDWQSELEKSTRDWIWLRPADELSKISHDFAAVRAKMKKQTITDSEAAAQTTALESRMVQWSVDTLALGGLWSYHEVEVDDSPHVWNNIVHSYVGPPAPGVWNTYRSVRILLSRTQELLSNRLKMPEAARKAQHAYFRVVRRQLTDDICAGAPCQLGHAEPAYNTPCVLVSAYSSIWPLFFAGTCALERIGRYTSNSENFGLKGTENSTSAAVAQARWIIGRLDYISASVGLHWADGVSATLRGDFSVHSDLLPDDDEKLRCKQDQMPPIKRLIAESETMAPWARKIQESGRGPRVLIEESNPLTDVLEQRDSTKWIATYDQDLLDLDDFWSIEQTREGVPWT